MHILYAYISGLLIISNTMCITPFVRSLLEIGLGYFAFELPAISLSTPNKMQTQYKSGWSVLFGK